MCITAVLLFLGLTRVLLLMPIIGTRAYLLVYMCVVGDCADGVKGCQFSCLVLSGHMRHTWPSTVRDFRRVFRIMHYLFARYEIEKFNES